MKEVTYPKDQNIQTYTHTNMQTLNIIQKAT